MCSRVIEDFTPEFNSLFDEFLSGVTSLAILGIGNEMNGDDAAGLHVISTLKQFQLPSWITLFYCEKAPEHFLGKLYTQKPNRVIVIDAANLSGPPGAIGIIPTALISKQLNFSTHTLSLTLLADFLKPVTDDFDIMFIGIKPKLMLFETPLSFEVKEAVGELAQFLFTKLTNTTHTHKINSSRQTT